MNQIAKMIEREVLNWSGVTEETHLFGGIEFRVNNDEIRHLNGDYLAFLPFPQRSQSNTSRLVMLSPRRSPLTPQKMWGI